MGQLELEQKKSDDLENKFEELKKQVEEQKEELKKQVEEQKADASSKQKQFEDLTSKQNQLELEQKKSDDLENKLKGFVQSMFTNLANQHITPNQKKAEELKQQVEEQKEDASSKEKQFEDLTSKQNLFEQNTNKKLSELVPLLSRVKQVEQTVDSKVNSLREEFTPREEFTTFLKNQADRDTKKEQRVNDVEQLLEEHKV